MALNRTLLQNGCVITVDKDLGNFWRADILIEGTKIAAVGPDLGVTDAEVIDASNMIVMPRQLLSRRSRSTCAGVPARGLLRGQSHRRPGSHRRWRDHTP